MPIYEYECRNCGTRFEKMQPITSDPVKICPNCGAEQVRRVIQPVGVIFKGSGWYITDNRKSTAESVPAAKSDTPAETKSEAKPDANAEAKSDSKSETKSEAKPAAKSETKSEAKPAAKSETKGESSSGGGKTGSASDSKAG
jgi:putative FmdB family regulatory protein